MTMVMEIFRCMFVDAVVDVMLFSDSTPLLFASFAGCLPVVKHLIEHKANMEAKDNDGDGAFRH